MFRSSFVLLIALPLSSLAGPKEDAELAWKFQLELAKAKQRKPEVSPVAAHKCYESLADAKAAANRDGKHLIILVGMTCDDLPAFRDALSDCVFCHQASYNGSAVQRLLIPTDAGSWSFPKAALDRKQYSPSDVRAVLGKRLSAAASHCPTTG